jgi:hypothetical protein
MRKRPTAAYAAPTEQGSLKTTRRTDADAVNATLPTQQEVMVETFAYSTTNNTTTTLPTKTNESPSSGTTAALVREASRC